MTKELTIDLLLIVNNLLNMKREIKGTYIVNRLKEGNNPISVLRELT